MKNTLSFSLIELMVVIAIIAVLAAVSVPAYQNYIISSRLSAAANIVDSLANQSIEFSSIHGRFAQAHDLGLSVNPSAYADLSIAQALIPASISIAFNDTSYYDAGLSDCGAIGYVDVFLNPQLMGFDSSINLLEVLSYFYNINGVIIQHNWFQYTTAANSGIDVVIPGWTNMHQTINNDWTYYNSIETPAAAASSCQ